MPLHRGQVGATIGGGPQVFRPAQLCLLTSGLRLSGYIGLLLGDTCRSFVGHLSAVCLVPLDTVYPY
jgi:hypothetical protein